MPRLFSYGTLRQPKVQAELFGGPVPFSPDTLHGWVECDVTVTDSDVIRLSGKAVHPGLVRGEGPPIAGAVLELTDTQLAAADDYEVSDYARVDVTLASGREAIVYVSASHSR